MHFIANKILILPLIVIVRNSLWGSITALKNGKDWEIKKVSTNKVVFDVTANIYFPRQQTLLYTYFYRTVLKIYISLNSFPQLICCENGINILRQIQYNIVNGTIINMRIHCTKRAQEYCNLVNIESYKNMANGQFLFAFFSACCLVGGWLKLAGVQTCARFQLNTIRSA